MVSKENCKRVNSIPLPALVVDLHIPHALQLYGIFIQKIQINIILDKNGGYACCGVHAQASPKRVNR